MGRACSTYGGEVHTRFFFVAKPEGRRPLERSSRIWQNNIKMDIGEVNWQGMDWIDLAQEKDRWRAFVNSVINFGVP